MQLAVFLGAALVVISRRPDAITNPQFFAEDGALWFSEAYRFSVGHLLLQPYAGYLQTLPRLIASLATLVPLAYAPLLMNLTGIAIQVLPVCILASARSAALGSLPFRLLLAIAYLVLPNTRELDIVITNAQWHLALAACLVLVAAPPRSWLTRAFDWVLLLVSGLSGPFCIFLVPVAAAMWWIRPHKSRLVAGGITALCAGLQLSVLLQADPAVRASAPLGASLRLFIDLLSSHVFLAAIFGSGNYAARVHFVLLVAVAVTGMIVLCYSIAKAEWELKLCLIFSLLVFAGSLKSPLVSVKDPQWPVLDHANGIRYWFFPMLAFVWSLLWCARSARWKAARSCAGVLVALMLVGILRDWEDPAFPDRNFTQLARAFERLPAGQSMVFPLYPNGWSMQLVKTALTCRELPAGVIDEPAKGARVSASLPVRGWVNGPEPVTAIAVSLDGASLMTLAPALSRPDVDAEYPGSPIKNKGWAATLDLSKTKPGTHVIEVRARLTNGCENTIGSRQVEVIGR
jgi:hypothetical protein